MTLDKNTVESVDIIVKKIKNDSISIHSPGIKRSC